MKEVIFILVYLIDLYYTGKFVAKRIDFLSHKLVFFSIGFVFQVAVIELLGWWIVAFRMPTVWFIGIAYVVMIGGLVLGIKENLGNASIEEIKKKVVWNKEFCILCVWILFICFALTLVYRPDADDSFYVSNVMQFSQSGNLNLYDSSFGNLSFGTVPMYDFQIWESYLAVLCRTFSIKASVMCHFTMVYVLLIVAASAYVLLGEMIFKEKKKAYLFTSVLFLFYIMGGYAVYSKGSFLLSRIWQGKAVYLHVVLPVVIAIMLANVEKTRRELWLLILISMLSGIGLNPTSMYVVGFQIIFMMLIITIYKKDWKVVLHIFPAIFVVGVFSILILLRASRFNGQIEAASYIPENFPKQVFLDFLGEGKMYCVIYVLCCVWIWFQRDDKAKILCIGTPVLLFIGIWNPVMAPIIAKTLTMVPSYWRVFWLLPIDFAIAYSAVTFVKQNKFTKIIFIILLSMVLMSGKYMFTDHNYFVRAVNKERIPDEVLVFGDIITGNGGRHIVLANEKASTTLRQEYYNIELIVSRYQYILDLVMYRGKQEEAEERITLMNFVNGMVEPVAIDYNYIGKLLNKYSVKWIIMNESQEAAISFLKEKDYSVKDVTNGEVLLVKTH